MAANGGCERDLEHSINEGYRAWRVLKSVMSIRGLVIKAKKCLYVGIIVSTALYGAEAWGMWSTKTKVDVFEWSVWEVWLKCHEWIELLMKRCVGELELKES